MPPSLTDSPAAWRRLALTVLAGCIGNAGMWSIIVVLPELSAGFGLDRSESALIFALTMTGFAVGNVLAGMALDRWGILPTILGAALLAGGGHLLTAVSPSPILTGAAQLAVGLGTAGCFGPLMADISHWFRRRRGIAVSIAASANYLSGVICPLALNQLMPRFGWEISYGLTGLMILIALPPLALALRSAPPPGPAAPPGAAPASKAATGAATAPPGQSLSPKRLVITLSLAGVACCVAMSMPQVHIIALCMDLGYGPTVGAEMLALMLAGGVLSRLAGGLISDRIGGLPTLLLFGSLQMGALFLYLPTQGLTPLYIVSLIFGLSQGGIVPAYAVIIREHLPAGRAGTMVGLVMMATILGMALGGWLSGAIYELTGSYTAAFLNGIAWNAANVALVLSLLIRRNRLQNLRLNGTPWPSA